MTKSEAFAEADRLLRNMGSTGYRNTDFTLRLAQWLYEGSQETLESPWLEPDLPWGVAASDIDPSKMEPGGYWYGLAREGDMHCQVLVEFGLPAKYIVDVLNAARPK